MIMILRMSDPIHSLPWSILKAVEHHNMELYFSQVWVIIYLACHMFGRIEINVMYYLLQILRTISFSALKKIKVYNFFCFVFCFLCCRVFCLKIFM